MKPIESDIISEKPRVTLSGEVFGRKNHDKKGKGGKKYENAITEKALTVDIRRLLRKHGGYFVKFWGGPMSKSGVADLLGVYRGRGIAIEVKRPGGKVTPEQEKFLRSWREAGGIAFIARGVRDVVEALDLPVLL